ncbi:hypothetical protein VKT23_009650 [Stygiomarasmius scandens]|uniref:ER-bound oxygenase mpaB/mpaB'/Rubber oxygenase catalytic domain-containing protein n=1 Tax=Marasmiellus scandens TaxID=2682957 RepID=A0ABR1JIH8_9AGAR
MNTTSIPINPLYVFLPLILCYLFSVRLRRWSHYKQTHAKFLPRYTSYGPSSLSITDAQEIIRASMQFDMPSLVYYGTSFALFKTYGIPTISKILIKTKELGSMECVFRRYVDTELFIYTWLTCPLFPNLTTESDPNHRRTHGNSGKSTGAEFADDPRANIAIARVNWLHVKYPILNEDFIYTLALFVFEPERWAKLYGWREFSDLEKDAYFIYWYEIGKRMGIKEIPKSRQELADWVEDYESRVMIPAQSNHEVANCTYPEQPSWLSTLTCYVLRGFSAFHYWFLLPRTEGVAVNDIELEKVFDRAKKAAAGECGPNKVASDTLLRMHPRWYQPQPWYKPRPTSNLGRLLERFQVALGLEVGETSEKWGCRGYRLEEMGPERFERVGHEETLRAAEKLMGCPIGGVWARGSEFEGKHPVQEVKENGE